MAWINLNFARFLSWKNCGALKVLRVGGWGNEAHAWRRKWFRRYIPSILSSLKGGSIGASIAIATLRALSKTRALRMSLTIRTLAESNSELPSATAYFGALAPIAPVTPAICRNKHKAQARLSANARVWIKVTWMDKSQLFTELINAGKIAKCAHQTNGSWNERVAERFTRNKTKCTIRYKTIIIPFVTFSRWFLTQSYKKS